MSRAPKLSVVIPVYNEAATVREIVRRVQNTPWEKEILVVDDGSTDGTGEILKQLAQEESNLLALSNGKNRGKGAALRNAFEQVRGDVVIIQDADLEYDPVDYGNLLQPISDGLADVVYGSRFLGGPHRVLYYWHYLGNRFLTQVSNALTNLNLTDMEVCYKVFRREVLSGLTLRSNGFGFEPEFTMKIAKRRWRIYEVPISYSGRTYAEGKKISWRDGFWALFVMLRYRFFD